MTDCNRCDFKAEDREQLADHAAEVGHPTCFVCHTVLTLTETRCCERCISRTRDHLTSIVDSVERLPAVAENTGWLNQPIPGGAAMILLAGGNIEGGGPDDHIAFKDPIDPLAVLEHNERNWRLTFRQPRGNDQVSVQSCVDYLLTHLRSAALSHPDFDDFAEEIATVASRLAHIVGVANDPVKATARCLDCAGILISPYRNPVTLPDGVTRPGLPWEGREMRAANPNLPDDEPEPIWECSRCHMIYNPVEYRLAVRTHLEQQAEAAG